MSRTIKWMLALATAVAAVVVVRLGRTELNDPPDATGAGLPLGRAVRGRGSVADSRIVARAEEPEWVVELARYVPERPAGPIGRAVAYAWASPATLVGIVVGLVSGAPPHLRDGVVVFAPVRGLVRWALQRTGFAATTMGHVVVAQQTPSTALMAHELVHVRQVERFGPLMGPLYWYLLARYGYARHPLERAARVAGREARHRVAGHRRPTTPPLSPAS